MPSFGNIVLADGQPTPVNRTFVPAVIDQNGVAHYEDQAGGIPIGYGRLSISLKRPATSTAPGSNSRGAVYRAKIKLEIPVLEVTSPSTGSGIQPAPTVAYAYMSETSFIMPSRGTTQERDDLQVLTKNALAHATVTSVVTDLQSIY